MLRASGRSWDEGHQAEAGTTDAFELTLRFFGTTARVRCDWADIIERAVEAGGCAAGRGD